MSIHRLPNHIEVLNPHRVRGRFGLHFVHELLASVYVAMTNKTWASREQFA